jgi:hypothetical protein
MDTRTAAVRRAGLLVMVPRLMIAAILWLVLGAALPWPGGWVVPALVALGIGVCLTHEPLMVRLLWCARTPSAPLPSPGGAAVLVTRRRFAGVAIAGRRHLVIPEVWASRADLPVLLADARRRQLVAAGRWDVAYRFVATPWLYVAEFATGFGRGLAVLPLVGFAWKLRPVVTVIAIVQAAQADHWASAIIIALGIGLTYLLPWTLRHEALVVDRAVGAPTRSPHPTPTPAPALAATPAGSRPAKPRPAADHVHVSAPPRVRHHHRIAAQSRLRRG